MRSAIRAAVRAAVRAVVRIGAAAGLLLAAPVAAQEAEPDGATPPAPTIEQRMDAYFEDQRGVGTFRALTGRGDPRIDPLSWWDMAHGSQGESARRLLALLFGAEEEGGGYWTYDDCRTDYPAKVLRERLTMFGRNHAYVEQWLRVQRVVLAHCGGEADKAPASLPAPLPVRDSAIARLQAADRAYQEAALLFYRAEIARARAAFARIAATPSPHKAAATYMVAAIDAGTKPDRYDSQPVKVPQALRESKAILERPDLAAAHPIAQGLIGWIGYNSGDPAARAAQVEVTLDALNAPLSRLSADPVARERYSRADADVDALHGSFRDPAWWLNGTAPPAYHASRAMAERAKRDMLATWLLFPASPFDRKAWTPLADGLNEDWSPLTSWLNSAPGAEADKPAWEVLNAGLAVQYDPAGWAAVDRAQAAISERGDEGATAALPILFYHQVRTALMYGEEADRAARFNQVAERLQTYPWPASLHYGSVARDALRYLLSVGRITEGRRLRDLVLPRAPEALDFYRDMLPLLAEDDARLAPLLANTSGGFLRRLSTPALLRLARRDDTTPDVRARLARTAWTRLYALGRPVPAEVDRLMRERNPDIAAAWKSRPGRVAPGNRAVLIDLLRTPGMNILPDSRSGSIMTAGDLPGTPDQIDIMEHSDNNWWCAARPARDDQAAEDALYWTFFSDAQFAAASPEAAYRLRRGLDPLLASSILWQSTDPAEREALSRIDSAPKQLSERAIAWAQRPGLFGRREGRDEALALAVRTTRYGCQRQGGHAAYSRAAFELLHRDFAGTPAATRTKYWFDCSHFYERCGGRYKEAEAEAEPLELPEAEQSPPDATMPEEAPAPAQ